MKTQLLLLSVALTLFSNLSAQVAYNYTGTGTFNLPAIIQAEDFIQGTEGVAFHDTNNSASDAWMPFRVGTMVNCAGWNLEAIPANGDADNTPVVGWVGDGEWLMYNVISATTKTYDFWVCSAGPNTQSTGSINVYIANIKKLSAAPYSAYGTEPSNWNYCKWEKIGSVEVTSGATRTMRIEFATGGSNVNAWALTESGKTPKQLTALSPAMAKINVSIKRTDDQIMISSTELISEVNILDLTGRNVKSISANDNAVKFVSAGLKGMYLISVKTPSGTKNIKQLL